MFPHFTEEETDAQRGPLTLPTSHSQFGRRCWKPRAFSLCGWSPQWAGEDLPVPTLHAGGAPSTKRSKAPHPLCDRWHTVLSQGWTLGRLNLLGTPGKGQPHSVPGLPLPQPERMPWPPDPRGCTGNPSRREGAAASRQALITQRSGSQKLQAQGEVLGWRPRHTPLPASGGCGIAEPAPWTPPLTVKVAGVILSFELWHKLSFVSQKPRPVKRSEEGVLLYLVGATCRRVHG